MESARMRALHVSKHLVSLKSRLISSSHPLWLHDAFHANPTIFRRRLFHTPRAFTTAPFRSQLTSQRPQLEALRRPAPHFSHRRLPWSFDGWLSPSPSGWESVVRPSANGSSWYASPILCWIPPPDTFPSQLSPLDVAPTDVHTRGSGESVFPVAPQANGSAPPYTSKRSFHTSN